jgi:hypothetical protein
VAEPGVRGQPDYTLPVLQNCVYTVPGNTVFGSVLAQHSIGVESEHTSGICAEPEATFGIAVQREYTLCPDTLQ